jgi:hypothetical protein
MPSNIFEYNFRFTEVFKFKEFYVWSDVPRNGKKYIIRRAYFWPLCTKPHFRMICSFKTMACKKPAGSRPESLLRKILQGTLSDHAEMTEYICRIKTFLSKRKQFRAQKIFPFLISSSIHSNLKFIHSIFIEDSPPSLHHIWHCNEHRDINYDFCNANYYTIPPKRIEL